MTDDIVARLRLSPVLMYSDQLGQSRIDYEACKKYINNEGVKMMREAADEIERLRQLLGNSEQLREERDEARQEICLLRASSTNATEKVSFEMIAYAASRGWEDLFADEGKHERDA